MPQSSCHEGKTGAAGEASASTTTATTTKWSVRDVWAGEDLGVFEGSFVVEGVEPHAARLVVLTPQ